MSEPISSPPPGRRARKRQQTLDLIAESAFRLFEAQGYDNVTMEQIAAEADVAKGTLYNHFPVKEAVLAHWIHQQLETDLDQLQATAARHADFEGQLSALLEMSKAWCEKHRTYLPHYLRYRFLALDSSALGNAAVGENGIQLAVGMLIGRAQQEGQLRTDLSSEHLAALFNHLYLGALLRWMTIDGTVLADELAAIVTLFMDGARHQAKRAPASVYGA